MCSPSPPPPPDYAGAAEATAAGNIEAMRLSTLASRPDEYTPLGSRTWTNLGRETFDQPGYDEAMRQYEADLAAVSHLQPVTRMGPKGTIVSTATPTMPTAPRREDFTTMVDQDKWRSDIQLTPEAQAIFEKNLELKGTMADLGLAGAEQMRGIMETPFAIPGQAPSYQGPAGEVPQYAGVGGEAPTFERTPGDVPTYSGPGYEGTRQNVVNAMMSRVSGDIQRDRDATHSQLVARGIPPGSEAYQREMELINRKETDARQQAEIAASNIASREFRDRLAGAGVDYEAAMQSRQLQTREGMQKFMADMQRRGASMAEAQDMYNNIMRARGVEGQEARTAYDTGMQTHQQRIADLLMQRQVPINELSAFRSGSQVQLPQFQGFAPQAPVAGPDYMGAAQAQSGYDLAGYNADVMARNQLMGGLFGLGSAAILASDIRLKHNYHQVGELPSGIPIYEFSYLGSNNRHTGVMAQDVLPVIPEAVINVDGFYAVNYAMLR